MNTKRLDMKKILFVVFMSAFFALPVFAQSTYKSAIGGRFGSTYYDIGAVSYKFFITDAGAIELNAGLGSRSYYFTGSGRNTSVHFAASYQHHFPIGNVAGLRWFIGGGPLIVNSFSDYDDYKGFGAGIFAAGGVDYKFNKIPLNVTADVRPTALFGGPDYYNTFYPNVGAAVRYTIGSR